VRSLCGAKHFSDNCVRYREFGRAFLNIHFARSEVPRAIKLIVDGYVRLKDREKIEELREHRWTLRRTIQEKAGDWFDASHLVQVIEADLAEIEAGLARLQ